MQAIETVRPRPGPRALSLAAAAFAMGLTCLPAAAQLRIVDYNVARLGGDPAAVQQVLATISIDDRSGFAVAPHVLVFQEVPSTIIGTLQSLVSAAAPPGISYALATYTSSVFEDGNGGAQALFFRTDTLAEITSAHQDLVTGAGRQTDRWKLRLLNYDSPDASFYIYGSHLRAGDSAQDYAERLTGVQVIRANADLLPAGTHIIFAGDFNFASSSDGAYVAFFNPGGAQAIDPLGTGSWAGASNAIKHTQSPRMITTPQLTGGGLDSRFDMQLSVDDLHDGDGLSIIAAPLACRAMGNDALHFDLAINDGDNHYFPASLALSNDLADALFDASDHVPLIVDYQVPAVMSATMPTDFGRVIVGSGATVALHVQNLAAVVHPLGADTLNFTVATDGGISGTFSGSASALSPGATVHVSIVTGKVGQVDGLALVTSTSEAVQHPSALLSTAGYVVSNSNPSFLHDSDIDQLLVEQSFQVDSGVHTIDVDIHNFGFNPLQALLDLEGVLGLAPPFALAGGIETGIGATPATLVFSINTTGLALGEHMRNLTIVTTDEDIPGESIANLSLTLRITITPGTSNPADLNGDGVVNSLDLGILLSSWSIPPTAPACGGSQPCPADLNGDGFVNSLDLGMLLSSWTLL